MLCQALNREELNAFLGSAEGCELTDERFLWLTQSFDTNGHGLTFPGFLQVPTTSTAIVPLYVSFHEADTRYDTSPSPVCWFYRIGVYVHDPGHQRVARGAATGPNLHGACDHSSSVCPSHDMKMRPWSVY